MGELDQASTLCQGLVAQCHARSLQGHATRGMHEVTIQHPSTVGPTASAPASARREEPYPCHMASLLLSRPDLDFLLYEWLGCEALTDRPRFAEHSRETFDAAMELSETVATRHFAPHNKRNDAEEPQFDGERVIMHPEVAEALAIFADTGLVAAGLPASAGGMQVPATLTMACFAWFQAANVGTAAYPFLTAGNANLLAAAHGSTEQIDTWVTPMIEGRFYGTMCLSEPQAGSSLADVATRAEPQPDGTYRVFGNKMWISGGEHELSENIVHLVLARVPGSPPGSRDCRCSSCPSTCWTTIVLPGASATTLCSPA